MDRNYFFEHILAKNAFKKKKINFHSNTLNEPLNVLNLIVDIFYG